MAKSGTPAGSSPKGGPQSLTEQDLKAIVDAEIRSGMGELSGELTEQRSDAMDRYLGEPDGREMEGRSQVNARDVLEVIEWILPALMRIFTTVHSVEIDPVNEEDEEQAQQETDYIRHRFFKKNNGFLTLYQWMKDALLQKTGIVKTTIEEYETSTRETYEKILENEFAALAADDDVEIVEHTAYTMIVQGAGVEVHDVTILRTESGKREVTENLPPEEFIISRDARSVFPEEARFCAHYSSPTISDLLEQGFTWNQIEQMELGLNEAEWNEETISRRHLSDEQRWIENDTANNAMRVVKMTECYLKADMNGDGIAEQLKVLRSGDFIEWEEVEDVPFDALTPVILTHKFFGLSVADLVTDLQEIRTGLMRAYMDNVHQGINKHKYYDYNLIDPDDMTTSRAHGVTGVDGPPAQAVYVEPPSGLTPDDFSMDEYIDKLKAQRIGDFTSQLDPNVLREANNLVVLEMQNEAKAKIEMIARIFAETGVKSLFRRLHRYARQYGDRKEMVQLRNQWVPVKPSSWRERTDFTVKVGLGTRNKQEAVATAQDRLNRMQTALEGPYGMMVVTPDKYYEAQLEVEEAMGEANPGGHWGNPAEYQPPPPQPDPQMAAIQATQQIESEKRQVEMAKMQSQQQIEQYKAQNQAMIQQSKAAIDELKAQIALMKQEGDTAAQTGKLDLDRQVAALDNHLKTLDLALQEQAADQKTQLEVYKAELASSTTLTQASMGAAAGGGEEGAEGESEAPAQDGNAVARVLSVLMDTINDMSRRMDMPRKLRIDKRDDDGRALSINGQPVSYDTQGRLEGIG